MLTFSEVKSIDQLDHKVVDEIEHFFIYYNQMRGKQFKPLGRHGPKRAKKLVQIGRKAFRKR